MKNFIQYILYLHFLVGSIALLNGALAISSQKGRQLHRKAGSIYFWAMTLVFITGIIMADYIATFTAFSATVVSRLDLMNPFLAFALPPLIGVPLLIYWQHKIEKSFTKTQNR